MRRLDGFLFSKATMYDLVEHYRKALRQTLEEVEPATLLSRSIDDLCAELEAEFRLAVPELKLDQIVRDEPEEVDIDVSHDRSRVFRTPGPHYIKGTAVSIEIPFEGNGDLFGYGSSPYNVNPEGTVEGQVLRLTHAGLSLDGAAVKTEFNQRISNIQSTLKATREQAEQWNSEMPRLIRDRLQQRKQKLLQDGNLAASIGYPLKRREGATYNIPVQRKALSIPRPAAKTEPFKPEPELAMKQYEDILGVMSNMALAIERSPSVFTEMHEEELRDFLLVMLNAIFEGQATGETFNREGKTDILIRVDGRNIFIAECKIWDGSRTLTDAIDQLLGYLCWRDTKAAIIVFSRRKNFSAVLDAIPETVKGHPNFKRQVTDYRGETSFRFVLGQKDDPNREITLTVAAFEVPAKELAGEATISAPEILAEGGAASPPRGRRRRS
jgi:hypothetical protein